MNNLNLVVRLGDDLSSHYLKKLLSKAHNAAEQTGCSEENQLRVLLLEDSSLGISFSKILQLIKALDEIKESLRFITLGYGPVTDNKVLEELKDSQINFFCFPSPFVFQNENIESSQNISERQEIVQKINALGKEIIYEFGDIIDLYYIVDILSNPAFEHSGNKNPKRIKEMLGCISGTEKVSLTSSPYRLLDSSHMLQYYYYKLGQNKITKGQEVDLVEFEQLGKADNFLKAKVWTLFQIEASLKAS